MCFTKKSIGVKQNDTQINKDTDSNIPNKKIYFAVYDSSGVSRQNSLVSRNNSLVSRNNSITSTGYIKTYIVNDFNWNQYDNKYIYKRKKSRYMYYE
jgi:hypothetical protein